MLLNDQPLNLLSPIHNPCYSGRLELEERKIWPHLRFVRHAIIKERIGPCIHQRFVQLNLTRRDDE